MTTDSSQTGIPAPSKRKLWQAVWPWGAHLLLWVGLVVGSLVLMGPMIQKGYPVNHSTHFNLSWGFQYQRQFFGGQFYPRWLEFSNFGFGNATFAFYPPLCMVATLPFRALGLGLSGSLVASMVLAIVLMGLGCYGCARCFFPRWIAVGVAAMGMASPYFLVDIFQRGAMGEVWAIVVIPWVLWWTQVTALRPGKDWPALVLAVVYGMLILSHLPTVMMFTLVWIPMPWLLAETGQRWQAARQCYWGLGLAAGWTAFYLWPAALDQRFINIDSVNAIEEYTPQERLMVFDLLRLRPRFADHWFDISLLNPWIQGVLVLVLTALVMALMIGLRRRLIPLSRPQPEALPRDPLVSGLARIPGWTYFIKKLTPLDQALGSLAPMERATLAWLLMGLMATLMMTDILGWIYPHIRTLQRIQFSWRWMAITAVIGPLCVGSLLFCAGRLMARWQHRAWAAVLASLALCLGGIGLWQGSEVSGRVVYQPDTIERFETLADQKVFPNEPQAFPGESFLYWHWIFPDGLALVDVYEYRAHGVTLPMPPPTSDPLLRWESGDTTNFDIQTWDFGRRRFVATNTSSVPQGALLRTLYYPGWRVRVDGDWIPTERTPAGQLRVTIPPGEHHVSVGYWGTLVDGLGRVGSLFTLLSMGSLLLFPEQDPKGSRV